MISPPLCPGCGTSRLVPIAYGYPHFTDELKRALEEKRLVLGGCEVRDEKWACPSCENRYPELESGAQ
ncbi:hypothetical protein GT755_26090 [Herbidospora sp. NEAU-GS84]|uniref:Uncharacterized protein n=1 Tax=Herbidospora solisilvae TaxID=2696284 RepID=A0A7C9JF72_9ACTN|nr:hypothetical protein [Herbidospora solisilvae]NAS25141.1 hypothetical protein [Herbidospora solisilvae]